MRTHRLTTLLASLLALSACDTTTSTPGPEVQFTGMLNGVPWQGTASAVIVRDTLYVSSERLNAAGGGHLHLAVAATGPGEFPLVAPSAYKELIGGDVLSYSAPATEGTVTLQQFSPAGGSVRGSVSLTVKGSRGTWAFTSGQFEADVTIVP